MLSCIPFYCIINGSCNAYSHLLTNCNKIAKIIPIHVYLGAYEFAFLVKNVSMVLLSHSKFMLILTRNYWTIFQSSYNTLFPTVICKFHTYNGLTYYISNIFISNDGQYLFMWLLNIYNFVWCFSSNLLPIFIHPSIHFFAYFWDRVQWGSGRPNLPVYPIFKKLFSLF